MNRLVPRRRPVSTYRLQLHREFGFADAARVVPYLARLGVTEAYSSPHFKATPGSRHGYDIGDHGALNPELGSEADYRAYCAALRDQGLGHIIDVVPNHMSADPGSNPWWRDVLENGPSSPYASYFDIDWEPVTPGLHAKVLLPILGDQYGRVLERGELQLELHDGALRLRYFERDLPLNPRQSPRVLAWRLDALQADAPDDSAVLEYQSILTSLQNLPAYTEREPARVAERQREKEVARARLARLLEDSPRIRAHVASVVRDANGVAGRPASFDRLHDLLEHQAYRLAYWRTASDEINYRRFFDINELVGLRMEAPGVFEATHALVARLLDEGLVTGLRIDHPDGLYDPAAYFDRLQELPGAPIWVVAEKILAMDEALPDDWRVSGTTGYSFLNLVSGLFVDARNSKALRRAYRRLTGRVDSFTETANRSRLFVMLTTMASELNVLAEALDSLSETDRRSRDFTLNTLRRVLREVVACYPVYRTYISARGAGPRDRQVVEAAIAEARRRNPVMDGSMFEFIRGLLAADPPPAPADAETAAARLHFAMKMQQFTAPVQAKGVEDTAFYRDHTLISANEVGGHPGRPSVSVEEFHAANATRRAGRPLELLATATHDTKRGEDARARIAAISEIPDDWRRAVAGWMRVNGRHRRRLADGWAPDRNDEYLFYQALVGVWPAELPLAPEPAQAQAALVDRLSAYMLKAVREAKLRTSWIHQNAEYEEAVGQFVERTLASATTPRFFRSFLPLQRRLARLGMINSLSQLLLKLTAPGVPDFYQGTELWDLALVDPDNRRPVDFGVSERLLDELQPLFDRLDSGGAIDADLAALVDAWPDGRIKLFATACGLRFRRAHADLVRDGDYEPLEISGPLAAHLVAFARRRGEAGLVTIAPRLVSSLPADAAGWPRGAATWGDTHIVLPPWAAGRAFRNILTGEIVPAGDRLDVATALAITPAAILSAHP